MCWRTVLLAYLAVSQLSFFLFEQRLKLLYQWGWRCHAPSTGVQRHVGHTPSSLTGSMERLLKNITLVAKKQRHKHWYIHIECWIEGSVPSSSQSKSRETTIASWYCSATPGIYIYHTWQFRLSQAPGALIFIHANIHVSYAWCMVYLTSRAWLSRDCTIQW